MLTKMAVNVREDETYFGRRVNGAYRHDELYFPSREDVRKAIDKMVRRYATRPVSSDCDVLFFHYTTRDVLRLHYEYVDYVIDDVLGIAYNGRYALVLDDDNGNRREVTKAQAKMLVLKHFDD